MELLPFAHEQGTEVMWLQFYAGVSEWIPEGNEGQQGGAGLYSNPTGCLWDLGL